MKHAKNIKIQNLSEEEKEKKRQYHSDQNIRNLSKEEKQKES